MQTKPKNPVLVIGNTVEGICGVGAIAIGAWSLITLGVLWPLILSLMFNVFVTYVAFASAIKLW